MCKEIVLPVDEGKTSSRARIRTVLSRKVVLKRMHFNGNSTTYGQRVHAVQHRSILAS